MRVRLFFSALALTLLLLLPMVGLVEYFASARCSSACAAPMRRARQCR